MPRQSLSRRLLGPTVAALLATAATGCNDLVQAIEDKAQEVTEDLSAPEDAEDPAAPQPTADEQLATKLDLYVECTRRASPRIRDSWARFEERAEPDGTPTKKNVIPFLYKIDSELNPCEDAAARGPTMEPELPRVDQAMADYLRYGKQLAKYTVQLDRYYEQRAFEDDEWALAKRVAPALAAAYEGWAEADTTLQTALERHQDLVDRNLLVAVQRREGHKTQWHCRNMVLAATDFVRCIRAEGAEAQGCEPAFEALEQAHDGFVRYDRDHPTESEQVFWMSAFRDSVSDYFTQSKALMDDPPRGSLAPDAIAGVVDEYEDLMNDSHNLRYER
ncbi:MAG: DUF3829 domain-containing protein [Nannocystaceae bacterium]